MTAELTLSHDEVNQLIREHLLAKCRELGLPSNIEILPGGMFSPWKAICRDDHEQAIYLTVKAESDKFFADLAGTVIREPDFKIIATIPAE